MLLIYVFALHFLVSTATVYFYFALVGQSKNELLVWKRVKDMDWHGQKNGVHSSSGTAPWKASGDHSDKHFEAANGG